MNTNQWIATAFALALGVALLRPAVAHDPVVTADADQEVGQVPLHDDLGKLTYRIDTSSELAQRYFDQGLRLTHAFNHAEALRSFRAARHYDHDCALCYWGEAFVLGPNINSPMDGEAENPALKAARTARRLARTPSEKALTAALVERYDTARGDRAALNSAYAAAMRAVTKRFAHDLEIAVFYVDAVMNTTPWDYWEADLSTPKGEIAEAIRTVEKVLAANPDHPGAIHYYIHLTEASKHAAKAEPYADKLAALMPGAGHLVHMPSHTYYRIGRYEDSAAVNVEAVAVDERSFDTMATYEIYRNGYYPHNIHFVIASAQMAGDAATAIEYSRRLQGKIADDVAARVGWVQIIKAAPYFAHAQFSTPQTILAIPDPGGRFPYVRAMWHYARGVAFAALGDTEQASREASRIAAINRDEKFEMLQAWYVPAPDLLRLARHVVQARIAQARDDDERAIAEFRTAVAIQDSLPYLEPPFWYYSVRQSLGAALLTAGRPGEAVSVLRKSLEEAPNNAYALYVLEKAQRALGDIASAGETARRIRQASIQGLTGLDIERL